jgi:hypothetical protein
MVFGYIGKKTRMVIGYTIWDGPKQRAGPLLTYDEACEQRSMTDRCLKRPLCGERLSHTP